MFQVLQSCSTEIISSKEETERCCEKNEKQQRSNCSLICLFFSFKYIQQINLKMIFNDENDYLRQLIENLTKGDVLFCNKLSRYEYN